MNDLLAHVTFTACFLGGLWFAYELVQTGHPWFALLVLLTVGSISVKTS